MSSRGSSFPAPAPRRDERRLRGLAVAAVAMTFLLVAIGGLVRATGSGEGCSGWPKCSATSWLPPLQYHAIIEYSHRMTAFLDIVLVGLVAALAWRRYRAVPRVFRPAMGGVALIILQAVLGGIVVRGALAPLLVTAHFATAMVLVADLVYLAVAVYTIDRRPRGRPDALSALARSAAAATFGLMVVGAYVRGENAGLAFPDWPLMNGRLVPSLASTPAALHFTHRVLAVAVGITVAALAVRAWRARRERPAVTRLALLAAGLFVVQVFIGAANVWSRLAQPAVVAHVAVSSLIWGTLVATAAAARAASSRAEVLAGETGVAPTAVPASVAAAGSGS
jgi:heme A synthase